MYTTSDLLNKIKHKAMVPESNSTFDNEMILAIADDVIALKVVPALLATQSDYLLTYIDYSTPSTSYDIPSRAVGMKIKDVTLVDSGSETLCPQIDDLLDRDSSGYYIRGNKIHFQTAPTKTVRIYYHLRPNKLIESTECAVVSSVTGSDVTVASLPAGMATVPSVDFIKSADGYDGIQIDQAVTSIAANVLTMTAAPSSSVVAGTYVCTAGYSPVIQVPQDLTPSLEWAVAAEILEALGDLNSAGMAAKKADTMLAAGIRLLDPRVDGVRSKRIINRDSELR